MLYLNHRKEREVNKMKMTQKAILEELRENDRELNKLFERREELGRLAKEKGWHDRIWDKLMDDGESHWSF